MKKIVFIVVFLIMPVSLISQNINGRISSSVYSFERYDTQQEKTNYIRSFQSLTLNVNKDNFSFRTRTNLETNFSESLENDPRLRFYNLYFELRNILDVATVRLGRQSAFNGVGSGLYDGVNLKLKFSGFNISGYYGGNVPAYQKLEFTDDIAEDYVLSGKIAYNAVENLNVSVAYIDKNFKSQDYITQRLDENLNLIDVLIQSKSNQYKYLSGNVSYNMTDYFSANARYDYDFNYKTTSKVEFLGRYSQIENLGISFYYNYREPRVRYNSIFAVFDFGNTSEIEGGIDYSFGKDFTVFGKFATVEYKDDNSQRISVGVNSVYGTLSYRKSLGYAGEMDAVSISTARSFFDGLLTPSIGLAFTSYKLTEDSPKNDLMTLLAGFNYRPINVLSFDIQGQYLNNKIYKNDFRILFKVNFWFNENLNIM
ncbi:MAG: hypothetical protein K8F36_01105 [Melioribacteraceae bacterium]|nr:hypothetical protein [Melioribacteraceae bacterium]MCO6472956.1 hypothetical protein [Melioribacteraceae bacterium]MDD3559019.1 hypothetical protein [Melioribacteraceae bacterium]